LSGSCEGRRGANGLGFGCLGRFRGGFLLGQLAKMLAHQLGVLKIERARVCLLLGNADLRQIVDQDFGLDLEFSGQFVDPDLVRF